MSYIFDRLYCMFVDQFYHFKSSLAKFFHPSQLFTPKSLYQAAKSLTIYTVVICSYNVYVLLYTTAQSGERVTWAELFIFYHPLWPMVVLLYITYTLKYYYLYPSWRKRYQTMMTDRAFHKYKKSLEEEDGRRTAAESKARDPDERST